MVISTSRREFLFLAGGVIGCLSAGRIPGGDTPDRRPNLLILYTDQQSLWTLGAYGGSLIPTPNIDRLAREGAVCSNFFTNSAVCTPSRGCFFTGRYPHAHGAYVNNREMNRNEVTFAQTLLNNGYETGYVGKWHLDGTASPGWLQPDRSMGFADCRFMYNRGHWKKITDGAGGHPPKVEPNEVIGDAQTYSTDWLATKTIEFIRTPRSAPFCFIASFPDPHTPYSVRAPYDTMFDPQKMSIPATFGQTNAEKPDWANPANGKAVGAGSEKVLRRDKAAYCGEVKCIDDAVGRILMALEEQGVLDRTVIVFTTDHGDLMGEHGLMAKVVPYDAAFHIPLIVRFPPSIQPGGQVKNILSTVDIHPTLLGLLGVPCGNRVQGRNASALLTGGKVPFWDDEVFLYHPYGLCAGICTPDYHMAYMRGMDAVLFDRVRDPAQTNNLFTNPEKQEVVARLTARIIDHLREVNAPELAWMTEPRERRKASA